MQPFAVSQSVHFIRELAPQAPAAAEEDTFYPLRMHSGDIDSSGLRASIALTLMVIVAATLAFLFAPRRVSSAIPPWQS